jgi:hypothetical protein
VRGFYEESPSVRRRRLVREKAEKNDYGVKVGQVYRAWDPRLRKLDDDKVTQYKVIQVGGAFATCDCTLPPVSPGAPARSRRSSIRLDRFGPKNYKLLKDVP